MQPKYTESEFLLRKIRDVLVAQNWFIVNHAILAKLYREIAHDTKFDTSPLCHPRVFRLGKIPPVTRFILITPGLRSKALG